MEPSKDAISVRTSRLNSQVLNKKCEKNWFYLTREGLFDTVQTLYDECNTECLKSNDKNIANFVDKFRKYIMELKKLRVNVTDFEIKNVIGRGHFGEVHVVKERQTGDIYAMKTVRKYENSKDKCALFEEERNIMAQAMSPWITKLQYAFQDTYCLYYVMEFQPGGDLLGLLYRQGGSIPESAATFYLAELVYAINDLHEMGYVHRDIKPDNILLDRCGHLKLADFGSATKLNVHGLVNSGSIPVGTPDYIAPETLQCLEKKNQTCDGKYGKLCDYWSVGVIAYELTIGHTPFTGQNTTATYSKIMNYTKSLKFPSDITLTQAYVNFIKNLLVDKLNRLDYERIVKHVLFKNIDLNAIRDQVPPFVPRISSEDDTSNFSDVQFKKKVPNMENYKGKVQFTGKNLPFIGFTFTIEPNNDLLETHRNNVVVKDERVEQLKQEIDVLQRKLIQNSTTSQEKENLEKKLEEKTRKLESIENIRDKLERDLATNIAECQALKRTLEIERKDRSDLERKALELIKSAKLKWESTEKLKLNNLNQTLEEYKTKIDDLNGEILKLTDQLHSAEQLSNKQKISMDNVEKLRRSSVIGLESRLERFTSDTQNKISDLQKQLSECTAEKKTFQRKLTELEDRESEYKNSLELAEKHCKELKSKCKESEGVIETIKEDLARLEGKEKDVELLEDLVRSLQEQISDMGNNKEVEQEMKKLTDSNAVLNKQVRDLKGELNNIRASKLSAIEDFKEKHEFELNLLKNQLKMAKNEKAECESKLQEANVTLQRREEKAGTLEILLQQLQGDLAKFESGSEREGVLQEQIERLEQQLVEVSANTAIDNQEMMQLKTKCWRMKKDLGNAELDKKIVERDLKEERILNKKLTEKINSLEIKVEKTKETQENAVTELGNLNEKLGAESEAYKAEIQSLKCNLEKLTLQEAKNLELMQSLKDDIKEKELKICAVLDTLDNVNKERITLETRLQEAKESRTATISEVSNKNEEITTLVNQLEKCKSELANSLLNREALRDACRILEDQLVEFETVLDCSEAKRKEMQVEIGSLQENMQKYKKEVLDSQRNCNKEKSLKLLAETKVKHLLNDIENNQSELVSMRKGNEELKQLTSKLNENLHETEKKLSDYEVSIKLYERQVENYASENVYLKEENSEQLTLITSLKESNYKLGQRYSESQSIIKDLVEKMNELDAILMEKTHYFNERELKAESTIQQQIKLIDFLQSKIEESNKKKKTFSDKLFGIHSKKENLPPLSVALNYKDLELQLFKEREQNKYLQQELIKLKSDLHKISERDIKNTTLQYLENQDDVFAQIVQSPSSQKSEALRQNSLQRMHHNIPHRFDSKLCTKSLKCAQCGGAILLGRQMCICRECNLVTHTSCSSSLPRTCGLPSEYAKHYSKRLNKIDSGSSLSSGLNHKCGQINIEGWVKIPLIPVGWEKHYACLIETSLNIYKEPPNNDGSSTPVQKLQLRNNGYGKVILEPVPSEIPVPVANSDLPFIIKVETSPNSTCWPSQSLIFMTLSIGDKDKWFSGLQSILQPRNNSGEVILHEMEDLEVNCIVDIDTGTKLIGTESGLHSLQKNKLVHLEGPHSVHEIQIIRNINLVIMLAENKRILICCDLNHLMALCDCAPCSKPTLTYQQIVNNLDGFHILRTTDWLRTNIICTATAKKLVIIKHDAVNNEFVPQRMLDTAEPVSCILFTDHSVLIGADKFFEVDLNTFEADEFLDVSDAKLSHAVKCFKLKSFPISILKINQDCPKEYLVCFNEFATFVDEYGRSTRKNDIYWTYLPTAFYFDSKYLYVLQFNSVDIYKIQTKLCDEIGDDIAHIFKIDLSHCQYLGHNQHGIYILNQNQIRLIDGRSFDDTISVNSEGIVLNKVEMKSDLERFSFTSSMVQSLDGHLSDEEFGGTTYMNLKKVTFTDL